ncbi:unnamed protein product [Diamesa hyperborea]
MLIYCKVLLLVLIASCAYGVAKKAVQTDFLLERVVRLPSNTLLKYTAYKDVSIQHFRIPIDTRSAYFSFKSYEEGKSAFARVCQPQDVTLHLKAGSYPVISPENITFPKHFLSADQRFEIHSLNFKSDGVTRRLTIDGPHPGNWFGVAFISWSDPNNERIEQQGLSASCETLLLSEMAIVRAHPKIITPNASYKDTIATNATEPRSYKFFVPRNVDICTWRLTIVRTCNDCTDLSFFVQSHSLPNHKNYLQNAIVNVTQANETIIDFYPHENAWHYVDLDFLVGETIKSTIIKSRGFRNYPLLRQTYREFFMFDYDLLPDVNGTVPLSINMTAGVTTLMKFDVGDVYDIGGTLSFAIAMKYDISGNVIDSTPTHANSDEGVEQAYAEKLVSEESNKFRSNQTVIVCMRLNEPGIPTWPDKCVYGRQIFPASSVINNTDADSGTGLIHVPFPESGIWYVTLGLFCHGSEQSVAAGSNYGSSYDGSCNTSVVFTISSSPCVAGRCGRNGRCYHYMSGGFVFSTCLCLKFYRGWDCTEDSQVPSSVSILVASLLLTLSNLLFIPSIYFAVRREYYTEAVIYFFAMFFSTFYHACDSGEEEFSFCLVKISVLQFCDFYCGLLAIWVTLIAMANVRPTFVSLLHMLGAILLAFGTELNKQSLWVFLAPALTGICIISVSWGLKCRKTKKWYPSRRYLAIFLPLGSVLVMVGLVCYAFLQTKQNYHIVHSIWHMVMALSILCLLPNRKTFKPKC